MDQVPMTRQDERAERLDISLYPADRQRAERVGREIGTKKLSQVIRWLIWNYPLPSDNGKEE